MLVLRFWLGGQPLPDRAGVWPMANWVFLLSDHELRKGEQVGLIERRARMAGLA